MTPDQLAKQLAPLIERMAEAAIQADLLRGMALSLGAFAKGVGR